MIKLLLTKDVKLISSLTAALGFYGTLGAKIIAFIDTEYVGFLSAMFASALVGYVISHLLSMIQGSSVILHKYCRNKQFEIEEYFDKRWKARKLKLRNFDKIDRSLRLYSKRELNELHGLIEKRLLEFRKD